MQIHMKIMLLTILCAFITTCSVYAVKLADFSPAECRAYGVKINDGQKITGEIVSSEFGTLGTMYKECGNYAQGCAKGVNNVFPDPDHKYEIWYSDHKCMPQHEACHGIYEIREHTTVFNLRNMQGDKFASCPS